MIRAAIATAMFILTIPVTALANGSSLPAMPDWQTEADTCTWHWREGGGIGLWAETCRFNDATWQVAWDEALVAFVNRKGDSVMGIAVQPFRLSRGASIASLSATLVEAGSLDANASCAARQSG